MASKSFEDFKASHTENEAGLMISANRITRALKHLPEVTSLEFPEFEWRFRWDLVSSNFEFLFQVSKVLSLSRKKLVRY